MPAPSIALTIAYWLHMLATVVWIGGLVAIGLIVLPAARSSLDLPQYRSLLSHLQTRLQPLSWFSMAILGVTGMFQMSSHSSYEGFLSITNSWSAAILLKHIVIGLMVVASAYMTWGVLPSLQRIAFLRATSKPIAEGQQRQLEKKESTILTINLALSVVVLALTAWARAAGS